MNGIETTVEQTKHVKIFLWSTDYCYCVHQWNQENKNFRKDKSGNAVKKNSRWLNQFLNEFSSPRELCSRFSKVELESLIIHSCFKDSFKNYYFEYKCTLEKCDLNNSTFQELRSTNKHWTNNLITKARVFYHIIASFEHWVIKFFCISIFQITPPSMQTSSQFFWGLWTVTSQFFLQKSLNLFDWIQIGAVWRPNKKGKPRLWLNLESVLLKFFMHFSFFHLAHFVYRCKVSSFLMSF